MLFKDILRFHEFEKQCDEHLTFLALDCLNDLSQNWHLKGFSPVWIFSCFLKSPGWINLLSQKLHITGLLLVWVFSWCFKCDGFLKLFSQTWHEKGLSSVWIFSWCFFSPGFMNFFSQYSHEYFFLHSLTCWAKSRRSEEMDEIHKNFTICNSKLKSKFNKWSYDECND